MSQTWVIKDTAPVDAASLELSAQQCSFTSNEHKFSSISIVENAEVAVYVLTYDNFEVAGAEVGLGIYEFDWSGNEAYKTLVFDTAPTGELLAWLQKNADPPIIGTLVTDRTQADVERVQALAAKGFASMTADEQAEWLAGMKGAYNAVDLNRVGTALNYLRDRLTGVCGRDITWQAKTDWAMTDVITAAQGIAYHDQISDVRAALTYPANAPDVPEIALLTYAGANDIERILTICETLVDHVIHAFRYTGAAECTAGGLL